MKAEDYRQTRIVAYSICNDLVFALNRIAAIDAYIEVFSEKQKNVYLRLAHSSMKERLVLETAALFDSACYKKKYTNNSFDALLEIIKKDKKFSKSQIDNIESKINNLKYKSEIKNFRHKLLAHRDLVQIFEYEKTEFSLDDVRQLLIDAYQILKIVFEIGLGSCLKEYNFQDEKERYKNSLNAFVDN